MLGQFKNANVAAIGNSFTTIYTAPADGAYFFQFNLANTDAAGIQVSVRVYDSSEADASYLIKNIPIPNGSSLEIINGQKIVLESGDYIEVKCDTASKTVDVISSLVENINE